MAKMTHVNHRFVQTATVVNGRVRIGQRVKSYCYGVEFTVEAIFQERDRRTGSCTFLCGPQGTRPIPALSCSKL